MKSTKESVHQLIENQITRLNLQAYYEVQKAEILGRRTQTSFTFHSLRDQSVDNIKSIEGLDILWVEEAQSASKKSWRTVIPTIRKPGSEIWVTFNPELETDDTYQQFVVQPPPNAVVVKTSYRDNPHLSEELRLEIEHLRATDPEEYEYVYKGMCRQAFAGAVYKNELLAAAKDGRICRCHMTPASLLTPSGTWAISITFRSGCHRDRKGWILVTLMTRGTGLPETSRPCGRSVWPPPRLAWR